MLAELAIANAAFSVIKETVQNGGDIMAAGQKVFDYFNAKSVIQKKAQEGGFKSELEEFMALEQLRSQEAELKELMIYQGRPGMWTDWLQFQVDVRKKNEEEARQEFIKKQKRVEALKTTGMTLEVAIGG